MKTSKREIERKYNKLLQEVSTKDFYKIDLTNRVNVYSCACGNKFKTIDRDAGVTPMFLMCDVCGTLATSSFYKDIAPELEPTTEWYRPNLNQLLKMRSKDNGMIEHVLSGGLECRKIKIDSK